MKNNKAKEPKALLEARSWKRKVSREIERKGWDQFLRDAHQTALRWQKEAASLREAKVEPGALVAGERRARYGTRN